LSVPKIFLIIIIGLLIIPATIQAQSTLNIGILKDADINEFELLSTQLKLEIEALTEIGDRVTFKEVTSAWDYELVVVERNFRGRPFIRPKIKELKID
jgi:hypothetical protein